MSLVDGPLHAELLVTGLAAGATAVVVATVARRPQRIVDLAALAAAVVLVARDVAPPLLLVAVAVALLGPHPGSGLPVRTARLLSVLAVAVAGLTIHTAGWPRAYIDVVGTVVVLVGARLPGPTQRWIGAALVMGTLAATWAGAPDTEAPLTVAAALAPALLASLWFARRDRSGLVAGADSLWVVGLLLVVWSAGEGYRGRPAGLAAPAIAAAAVVWWAGEARRRRAGTSRLGHRAAIGIAAAWIVVMAVASRTVGLDSHGAPAPWMAAATLALATASALITPGRRGGADTSPG